MTEVVVAESDIHGLGVFAAREFAEGETVLVIDDSRVVDGEHSLCPELGEYAFHCDYLAGGKVVLMRFPERHINSSCDPNTFVKVVGGIRRVVARRPLKAGEEITYDYIINCHGGDMWQCCCRSSRCRGTIVSSFFELPLELQLEYLPLLNEWFIAEHQEEVEVLRGMRMTADLIQLAGPVNFPGLLFRRFRGADYAAMSEVVNASNAADQIEETESADAIANYLENDANCDLGHDLILADVNGRTVGFGRVRWRLDDGGHRAYWQSGFILPEWRRKGIGRAILGYTESRACAHAQANPFAGPNFLQVYAEDTAHGKNALLESEGYTAVRYAFFMQRKDLSDLPIAPLPPGIELRPVQPEHRRAIWEAKEEAFLGHWGHAAGTEADYQNWLNDPVADPALWQVAWEAAADQIAGVSINAINADDNARYSFLRGLIGPLGVRRAWRGRGLGRALLVNSLIVLRERGMTEAVLGVDAENPNGALKLYESAGFRAINQDAVYRKTLAIDG